MHSSKTNYIIMNFNILNLLAALKNFFDILIIFLKEILVNSNHRLKLCIFCVITICYNKIFLIFIHFCMMNDTRKFIINCDG